MTDTVTTLAELRQFRRETRDALRSLLGAQLRPNVRPEAWTPREVFHHVLLIESTTADMLERLASKAGALPARDPAEPWPFRAELMDFPLDTAFSVPAFRGSDPKRDVSDKVLDALEESTWARHDKLAELADARRFDTVSFPHPLAGKLNFYEWLVFGGIHERLHLTQLRRDIGLET